MGGHGELRSRIFHLLYCHIGFVTMKKGLTVLQKTSRKDLVVEHLMETKNIAICSK